MGAADDVSWDLAGRLSVSARGLGAARERSVAEELDPFPRSPSPLEPDVVLAAGPQVPRTDVVELHGPSHDGRTTARDRDGRLLARYGDRWASVPSPGSACPQIDLEPGLDPSTCWGELVRPTLLHALGRRDCVAVHSAAVEWDGQAVLLSGWSESGKTEVALAMVEEGAGFLSDKWTVAGADGEASAFPVGVGVRGWALPALPRLRSGLPGRAKAQLGLARAAGAVVQPSSRVRGRGGAGGRAAGLLQRAVELGDRAGLSPSEVRRAYGDSSDPARRLAMGTVVVLVTAAVDEVVVERVSPEWAARRLARSGAYERRRWTDLQERGTYAGLDDRGGARDAAIAAETRLMATAFRAARVLRVTCPFPGDPRRVVQALASST